MASDVDAEPLDDGIILDDAIGDRRNRKASDTDDELEFLLDDEGDEPRPIGAKTVADMGARTVDLGQIPADSAAQAFPAAEPLDESADHGLVSEQDSRMGSGTIEVRAGAQTIDVDAPDERAGDKPGTVPERQIAPTLDSSDVPGDVLERVKHTWQRTAQQVGVTIQTSLKADVSADADSQTTLVIQPRSVRPAKGPRGAPADYDLLKLLGEGGMGLVYAARQASIDRTVAVKMLKPSTAADKTQRNKFLSEACVTGDLEHPNIVPIYDLGRNSEGALFYAMKRVQGTPWDKAIRDKSPQENIEILMKVSDAVAFAHSRGVIHRDLKPENVMLGGFGEVLVMDWGLAVPTDRRRTIAGIRPSVTMGGTPAYMAPEMAAGPFERIGPASDIYLLGAILYEIITGRTPHTGKDVMKCLFAAARNDIQSTNKTGELVEIALRAMQSVPEDRYPSVQAFQAAIREYQSHSESLALSMRAAEHLAEADQTKDYQDYACALFGFQQAIDLWDGNEGAKASLLKTKLAYASCAKAKGDYDLGASLLDLSIPQHAQLHRQIKAAQQEREARQQRLKTYKRIGIGMAGMFFAVVTGAAFLINMQRAEAVKQRTIAQRNEQKAITAQKMAEQRRQEAEAAQIAEAEQRKKAEENFTLAEQRRRQAEAAQLAEAEQRQKAEDNFNLAEERRKQAEAAQLAETEQRKKAEDNFNLAEVRRQQAEAAQLAETEQRKKAEENLKLAEVRRQQAEAAQEQERLAKEAEAYEAYVARIGAAAAKIEENAYDSARELLELCIPGPGYKDYRNWEWGRLWRLCHQAFQTFPAEMPLECVAAYAADGEGFARIASGGSNGKAVIWNKDGEKITEINAGGAFVHAIAFSPDGRYVATGTSEPEGFVRLFDASTGRLVSNLTGLNSDGHAKPVLSVEFSADGRRLLTGSYDETAKVWDIASGRVLCTLHGHNWWVWNARFCPERNTNGQFQPEKKIVTVSQDGMAIIWTDATGTWTDEKNVRQSPRFRGHDGPIYAAAFSPDGRTVATAGHDKRVLIWNVQDLEEFDYDKATDQFLVSPEGNENGVVSPPIYQSFQGHAAAIRSLAFSQDGRLLASAGHDNTVKIWNVQTGKSLKTLRGHGEWVRACTISPDSKWVLSASYDHQVRLWDVEGYEELRVLQGRVLEGHDDSILAAAFSRDATQIVTASRDRTIKTWDFQTGQEQRSFHEGHAFLASSAVFFPGGQRLATAAVDNTVRIWDVATGAERLVLEGTGRSAAVAVSPDGKWLLTGGQQLDVPGQDRPIWLAKVWNSENGQVIHELEGHYGQVSAVAISRHGNYLFTGDITGLGNLWNAETGELVRPLKWHGAKIIAAVFLGDDRRLLTASLERGVVQWDFRQGTVDQSRSLIHPRSLTSMDASLDGQYVLTSCMDHQVRLWDVNSAQLLRTFTTPSDQKIGEVNKVAISPDDRFGLTVNADTRTLRIWDLRTGREQTYPVTPLQKGPFLNLSERSMLWSADFSLDGRQVVTVGGDQARLWDLNEDAIAWRRERMSFSPHGVVASASFSFDGSEIVSGSWDGSARIWNVKTGEDRQKLMGQHTRAVNCAVFSPDRESSWVLTASDDGSAGLWNAKTGEFVRRFVGHASAVLWAEFSRDGQRVLTASTDLSARIWDIGGRELLQLRGHTLPVTHAAFSADGRRVVTGSEDDTAKIWDVATGQELFTLAGHTATVTSVTFSPDGQRVLTGSEDFTAKLWDATTGKEILTLKGHEQELTSVAFDTIDGHYALTGSHDGTAIVWLASPWKQQERIGKRE